MRVIGGWAFFSVLLVAVVGCARREAPAAAARIDAAPAAAAVAAVADAAPARPSSPECREYQTLLRSLAKDGGSGLPGRTDREIFLAFRYPHVPIVGGGHPLAGADEDFTDAALQLGHPSDQETGSGVPQKPVPYVYLAAHRDAPAAGVKALLSGPAKGKELRLLLLRSDEELFAQLTRAFPHTPPALAGGLGRPLGLERHIQALSKLSRPCPLGNAFASISRGGGMDVLFPAVADALEACHCDVVNLDGFVSLLAYAMMPWADGSYVVVDAKVLARLPAGATIADLATALVRAPAAAR